MNENRQIDRSSPQRHIDARVLLEDGGTLGVLPPVRNGYSISKAPQRPATYKTDKEKGILLPSTVGSWSHEEDHGPNPL